MGCVLALDAGGTQTRCWLVRTDGTVLGRGHGGPGNHVLDSFEHVRASFHAAVDAALLESQADRLDVTGVVAGCAGIEATGETRAPIERLLEEIAPKASERRAVGDMVAAFRGALPEGVGIVTIAGTGAVTYGEDGKGATVQVDGWGNVLGDDGSGYSIGRSGLRAAAQASDGRGAATHLVESLPRALGVESMQEAAYRVYAAENIRAAVAPLAKVVTETAQHGDEIARSILTEAGESLAEAAIAALFRLQHEADIHVATVGGVFSAGELIREPFSATVGMGEPGAQLVEAALPPVGGAAMIACSLLGEQWGTEHVARARETARALGG